MKMIFGIYDSKQGALVGTDSTATSLLKWREFTAHRVPCKVIKQTGCQSSIITISIAELHQCAAREKEAGQA